MSALTWQQKMVLNILVTTKERAMSSQKKVIAHLDEPKGSAHYFSVECQNDHCCAELNIEHGANGGDRFDCPECGFRHWFHYDGIGCGASLVDEQGDLERQAEARAEGSC
jgi:hypothetical protein